jgi:hypothetical protein
MIRDYMGHCCSSDQASTEVLLLSVYLGKRCSKMERKIMVVTLWHLWDARNKVREGEPMMHHNSVAKKALAYIQMIATHPYKHIIYNQWRI